MADALVQELGVDPASIIVQIGDPDKPYQSVGLGLVVDHEVVRLELISDDPTDRGLALCYSGSKIARINPVQRRRGQAVTQYVIRDLDPAALQKAVIHALNKPRLSDPNAPAPAVSAESASSDIEH